jgi:hypothetical protein
MDTRRHKVFIIEDEAVIVMEIESRLSVLGCDVTGV